MLGVHLWKCSLGILGRHFVAISAYLWLISGLLVKSWFSGRGWGQQLFSFQSPAVQWMARTSSLNCLSRRHPYQTPDSLNCLPPFHWKPLFFTENCFIASPSQTSTLISGLLVAYLWLLVVDGGLTIETFKLLCRAKITKTTTSQPLMDPNSQDYVPKKGFHKWTPNWWCCCARIGCHAIFLIAEVVLQ